MHELSIAMNIVEIAESVANEAKLTHVDALHLRLGLFSGVVKDSLFLAYEIATKNTILTGSRLVIEELPLLIYCSQCQAERQVNGIQLLECPVCGTASNDIRQGKEIELGFLEVDYETETT